MITCNLACAVISRFHHFQIKERYDFFSFFESLFYTRLPFPLPWWSKDLLVDKPAGGGQLRNPPVKFRNERWLHLAIDQHPVCPNRARRELWPRKWFLLGRNPWRYACRSIFSLVDLHVDRRRWRSILVWSRQLTSDLMRCFLFWKCLHWSSLKVVFGAYVCHRRPAGLPATSDLVTRIQTLIVHFLCSQTAGFCMSRQFFLL